MRFFLVDRVNELVPGDQASGIKCWSLDNEIFKDHFKGFPAVPGVLLTESMAQLAGMLIEKSYYKEFDESQRVFPLLSIIQKAKFRRFVRPGDQCILQCKLKSLDVSHANVLVTTEVNGEVVADAKLTFMIGKEEDVDKDNEHILERNPYYYTVLPKDK